MCKNAILRMRASRRAARENKVEPTRGRVKILVVFGVHQIMHLVQFYGKSGTRLPNPNIRVSEI